MAGSKGKPRKIVPEASAPEPVPNARPTSSTDWSRVTHFVPREFTCRCDGLCDHPDCISGETVEKLDKIRDLIGTPVTILSGTRCERHNRKVGGTERSAHVPKHGVSHAADVHCPDATFRYAFLVAALPMFNRIGIGSDFIHVDDDPELPRNVMWLYGPDQTRGNLKG